MNKKLSMAVASAVLAMGATAANAGITIPAGDWTIDIGGNVNGFYTWNKADSKATCPTIQGAIARCVSSGTEDNITNINTGLLPSAIGIGGKTRQNDLDVAFQFTFFPGISSNLGLVNSDGPFGGNSLNIRQAYLTFGDKSWGTVKVGRDLGIYESDAILSDMTLLGVGGAGWASGTTTLGRIGLGYLYADWNAQISYWSPNWNGFSFAVGVFDPWVSSTASSVLGVALGGSGAIVATPDGSSPQWQGKVAYEWGGDVSGKVWAGFIYQQFNDNSVTSVSFDDARGWDIGGKVSVAGFEAVASYYNGEAIGTTGFGIGAHASNGNERDSDGWYVQGTYKLPNIGTKLGVSYGVSKLDTASGEVNPFLLDKNKMWTVGAYHPLTKSLNLVAEYNDTKSENQAGQEIKDHGVSLGAILFF